MRVALHEVAIREEAGRPLFSVHHEVSRSVRRVPADLPLRGAGGSGRFHLLEDILWGLTVQDIRQCGVAAADEGVIEAVGMEVTASLHDQATLPREERVARRRRKASPTLVVPGHSREARQRRRAAHQCRKQVGNGVLRQMCEGQPGPAGALDLDNDSRRAHPMAGPVENFCVEPSHGHQQPKRLQHLPGAQRLAARAALNQESEFGPLTDSGLRVGAEIGQTLLRGPAEGSNLGELGGFDIPLPRAPGAKPHRQTLDCGRGHPAMRGTVDFEDWGQRAHREALGFLEREPSVRRGVSTRDTQAVLEGTKMIRGAGQTATQTGADPDQVAPWLDTAERRVVGRDRARLARGNSNVLGDGGQRL